MQPTTNKNYYEEDEINLKDFFNKLIASKKLIITTTLLLTLLAGLSPSLRPTSFESSALIQIGQYNLNNDLLSDTETFLVWTEYLGKPEILIQKQEDIIDELRIAFIHKSKNTNTNNKITFSIIDKSLIEIVAKTYSITSGENIINEILSYIQTRHENIVNTNNKRISKEISNEIKIIDAELDYHKNKVLLELNAKLLESQEEASIVKNKMNIIDSEISFRTELLNNQINDESLKMEELSNSIELFNLNQEKTKLESQLDILTEAIVNISYDLDSESLESRYLIDMEATGTTSTFSSNIILDDLSNYIKKQRDDLGYYIRHQNSTAYFQASQEKSILQYKLQLLKDRKPTKTTLIGKITTDENKPKTMIFALFGFMLGMILSIILVLVIGIFKNYKEKSI